MSHQVIITFDMDETKVQENAEKEAGRQIAAELMKNVFEQRYYSDNRKKQLADMVQDVIKEMLEPYKEEIIKEAVKNVTDGLNRTKAVKEKLAEVLDE